MSFNMEKSIQQEKNRSLVAEGMDIFVTEYVADSAAAILYRQNQSRLLSRFSENYLAPVLSREKNTGCFQKETEEILKDVYFIPLSYGGIYQGLWNMTGEYKVGFRIVQKEIPIHQETVEICNFFDVNPYGLYSKGSYLFVAENGILLAEKLREKKIPVRFVGKITKEKKKVFLRGEEERFLERPKKDFLEGKNECNFT